MTRAGAAAAVACALPLLVATPAAARTPPSPYVRACRQAGRVVATRTALPPLPLTTLIPSTRLAVVARVDAVLYQGRKPPAPKRPPGFVGPIPPEGCQVVRLLIQQTLKGTPASRITVVKPEAPYRLRAARPVHAGTFLLDGASPYPGILGNYGPDPYPPSAVTAALAGMASGSV